MLVKRFDDFSQLPERYSALFDNAARASFDTSREWYTHLAATALDPAGKVILYGVEHPDGNRPVAILPVRHARDGRALFSLSTYYSSLYAPLVDPGEQDHALTALFKSLKGVEPCWESLRLHPMPSDQPIFSATLRALKCAGWWAFPYYCFGNWYLPVEGRRYDQYSGGLPSRLRNTIKRKGKQFFSQAEGRLEIVTGGDSVERAIDAYNRIYLSSWKKPEPFPDFIPGMIRLFANKGQLRLGIAYVHEVPVAAQIWIVSHGKAAIYKLAYDEQFSSLSAGSILTEHLMRHVIDVDQVNEIDYLVGDDAYKKDWMSHRRERWGIVAYNPRTMTGMIGGANEMTRRTIKAGWAHLMKSVSAVKNGIGGTDNSKGDEHAGS
ncbi:MAG: GNAT family N-acetyltransferase [Nitrosomonadales bacterium]|nr:GNAT family N-acetyltransferase [Nitrosomonadales bacterium]